MKQTERTSPRPVRLRLTVIEPPAEVRWAVQLGRDDLLDPATIARDRVVFDIPLEIVPSATGGSRIRGPAVQGPPGGRFLYVNSGTRAGEATSCWDRRAKVSLLSVSAAHLQAHSSGEEVVLEGEIDGTGEDGGPACASVPLLRAGWTVAARTG